MNQDNIRLHPAMTQELNHHVRAWSVDGLHVEVESLPENATVSRTSIMKSPDTGYMVLIHFTIEKDVNFYTGTIAEFSTLQELQDKFPLLFELDGHLYAFA